MDKITKVFDSEQAEVLVSMQKDLRDLKNAGQNEHDYSDIVQEVNPVIAKDMKQLKKVKAIWSNNGRIPGVADRFTIQDLMKYDLKYTKEVRDGYSNDHPLLIPRVVSEVVKESIEPNIVLTPLLQRINYSHGTQLSFPSTGAFSAADIPEGGEYPIRSLDMAGQVVATIGKSGLAVMFSEETLRYSLYDVMSMHLRAAGKALIRWKEQKVADMMITAAGGTNTLFDNTTTSYPSTTGRNASGYYNGSVTLDDFFKAYATMIARGFMPNTLIMNPFAWQIFADEGLSRLFGFEHGTAMWGNMQGGLGNAPQWKSAGMNGLLQSSTVTSPQNVATTFTNVPSIFPYPFKIIVSPYMPYDAVQNVTDFILCDSNELGVLVVDEEVTTDQWDDLARDITKIKLRERYAVATMNNGQGTGLFKGVSLAKSFDFNHNYSLQYSSTSGAFTGQPLSGDSAVTTAFFTDNY